MGGHAGWRMLSEAWSWRLCIMEDPSQHRPSFVWWHRGEHAFVWVVSVAWLKTGGSRPNRRGQGTEAAFLGELSQLVYKMRSANSMCAACFAERVQKDVVFYLCQIHQTWRSRGHPHMLHLPMFFVCAHGPDTGCLKQLVIWSSRLHLKHFTRASLEH